jgi:hypothetical protein
MSADSTPLSQETKLTNTLLQTQQDCIAALKLNLNLVDEKLGMAVQAAETWKSRYENLEKQALELQSKYLALMNPPKPAADPQ